MTGHANVYVSAGKWRGESFDGRVRVNGRYRRRTVEFTAQTARAAFYRAYIARIGERLQEAREQAIRENAGLIAERILDVAEDDDTDA